MQINESRYHVLNTLFELPGVACVCMRVCVHCVCSESSDSSPAPPPETFMLAALVDYFDNHPEYTKTPFGVEFGSVAITYESIQEDVRQATDWVHREVGVVQGGRATGGDWCGHNTSICFPLVRAC